MVKQLLLIIAVLCCLTPALGSEYRVIRVVDGDTVYLDFNNNGIAEKRERVRLSGIDAFEVRPSENMNMQMKDLNISAREVLTLGYLGKEFAAKELLWKTVNADFTEQNAFDKYNRPLMSITYDNGKDFEEEILKSGLAVVFRNSSRAKKLKKFENRKKIKENLKRTQSINLMYYSRKENRTYPITSDQALNPENILINTAE